LFGEKRYHLKEAVTILHDAEIVTIMINRKERIAELHLEADDSTNWRVKFRNFIALRGVDLTQQNVVSRLFVSTDASFSKDEIYYWLRWANSLIDVEASITDEELESYHIKISKNELQMLLLEPAAGIRFVVLCEDISFWKVDL
jgi:hypothetical protein